MAEKDDENPGLRKKIKEKDQPFLEKAIQGVELARKKKKTQFSNKDWGLVVHIFKMVRKKAKRKAAEAAVLASLFKATFILEAKEGSKPRNLGLEFDKYRQEIEEICSVVEKMLNTHKQILLDNATFQDATQAQQFLWQFQNVFERFRESQSHLQRFLDDIKNK